MTQIGLPQWLSSKEFVCNAEATGEAILIPGLGRSPGGGHSNPLQYSSLANLMDKGAWWATVHRAAKSDKTEVTEHAHMMQVEELNRTLAFWPWGTWSKCHATYLQKQRSMRKDVWDKGRLHLVLNIVSYTGLNKTRNEMWKYLNTLKHCA